MLHPAAPPAVQFRSLPRHIYFFFPLFKAKSIPDSTGQSPRAEIPQLDRAEPKSSNLSGSSLGKHPPCQTPGSEAAYPPARQARSMPSRALPPISLHFSQEGQQRPPQREWRRERAPPPQSFPRALFSAQTRAMV